MVPRARAGGERGSSAGMKLSKALLGFAAIASCCLACSATVGTAGMVSVPKDASATCSQHCSSIGMSLDAVVVMANNVGCVCRGVKSAAADSPAGASAGGMAALMVQQQQQQQQQRR